MRRRSTVALLVALGVTVLSALAHATPPDPTWIGGVYDAADGDDVVGIAMSGDLAADAGSFDRVQLRMVIGGVETREATARAPDPRAAFQGRAPPSA